MSRQLVRAYPTSRNPVSAPSTAEMTKAHLQRVTLTPGNLAAVSLAPIE
jgi:hypothetical protein